MKILSLFFIFCITTNTQAQEIPPFANITSVEYRGTGCDAESASVAMTPDLSYLSVLYDRFSVEVGSGTVNPNANMEQKNCIIIVKFDLPAGWSLQFDTVEYRGFVSLPSANTIAQQMISVETLKGKGRNFEQNIMRGPKMENFVTIYKNPIVNSVESEMPLVNGWMTRLNNRRPIMMPQMPRGTGEGRGPGGRGRRIRSGDFFECSDKVQQAVLRIRSRIGVRNAGDRSNPTIKMVVDSTDASFNQKLKINWNKCMD